MMDNEELIFQSTHPLRDATTSDWFLSPPAVFQSTHPLRDATRCKDTYSNNSLISIHAPLTGCDWVYLQESRLLFNISIHAPLTGCDQTADESRQLDGNFNPRTPYGMRRDSQSISARYSWFQSTHPLRDATATALLLYRYLIISIHAPLTGCDWSKLFAASHRFYFNPRTPYGMRQMAQAIALYFEHISIHAPLTGCDCAHSPRYIP